MLAVSPCSAVFTSPFFFDVSLRASVSSPVPLWLRLAGGTGGISLWRDIFGPSLGNQAKDLEQLWFRTTVYLGAGSVGHAALNRRQDGFPTGEERRARFQREMAI